MKPIGGMVYVRFDDVQLEVYGDVTFDATTVERTVQTGLNGPVGYTETGRTPFIEVQVATGADFPFKQLRDATDVTVTAELNTGRVVTITEAVRVQGLEENAGEGTVTVRFEGKDGRVN